MLNVINQLPNGFLNTTTERLHEILPGPTLICLPGKIKQPLFVAILLHGNEDTGLFAIQALLRKYTNRELPRGLMIFIGNIEAARYRRRRLEHQPDYNRIWQPGNTPEYAMAKQVMEIVRSYSPFACVDVHNNTGINPHHVAVSHLDHQSLQLASLFSREIIYFTTTPEGTLSAAFTNLCPSVTIECGQVKHNYGTEHAVEFLEGCLHLTKIPTKPVHEHDFDLFHVVAVVKVPPDISFGFGSADGNTIGFIKDLDHLNFRELSPGTVLAQVKQGSGVYLQAWDEQGNEIGDRFFAVKGSEIRLTQKVMPSMLTLDHEAIRQDCLCYFMERYPRPK